MLRAEHWCGTTTWQTKPWAPSQRNVKGRNRLSKLYRPSVLKFWVTDLEEFGSLVTNLLFLVSVLNLVFVRLENGWHSFHSSDFMRVFNDYSYLNFANHSKVSLFSNTNSCFIMHSKQTTVLCMYLYSFLSWWNSRQKEGIVLVFLVSSAILLFNLHRCKTTSGISLCCTG